MVKRRGQDNTHPLIHIGSSHRQGLYRRVYQLVHAQGSTGKRIKNGGTWDGKVFEPLGTDDLEVLWAYVGSDADAEDAEAALCKEHRRLHDNHLPLYDLRCPQER